MNLSTIENIFNVTTEKIPDEIFDEIISGEHFRLERIISDGQVSPAGFWYNQDQNEFVMLLSGAAKLIVEGGLTYNLKPGDYINLPAHKKHRVEWTDPDRKTIWLALHY